MSSPANGRALAIPLIWTKNQGTLVAIPAEAPVRSPSDEELMAGLQSHDADALEALFGRYARLVSGIAFRILRDYSEAEEVVQEAFFIFTKNRRFLTPQRAVLKPGLSKLHTVERSTEKLICRAEAFMLVQK